MAADVESRPDRKAVHDWATPLIVGFVLAPVCLLISVYSMGGGHGNYFWCKVFFPYTMLTTVFLGKITLPLIVVAIVQFPLYGAIVAVGARRSRCWQTLAVIVPLHALMAGIALIVQMPNFS